MSKKTSIENQKIRQYNTNKIVSLKLAKCNNKEFIKEIIFSQQNTIIYSLEMQ